MDSLGRFGGPGYTLTSTERKPIMSRASQFALDSEVGGGQVVALAGIGAQSILRDAHANRLLRLPDASVDDNITYTLPPAEATGDVYTFVLTKARTTTGLIFTVNAKPASTVMIGAVKSFDTAAVATDTAIWFSTNATTVTMNSTTQGGLGGDMLTFTDIGLGVWLLDGQTNCSGDKVTPLS